MHCKARQGMQTTVVQIQSDHIRRSSFHLKQIPIGAPEPYEHTECCRLHVFPSTAIFSFDPHMHAASAAPWAFLRGFLLEQVQWICLSDKSGWSASAQIHFKCPWSSVHVWGKRNVAVDGKLVSKKFGIGREFRFSLVQILGILGDVSV